MAARLLIIEDNPANLELMEYLLTAHGYTVHTARDGGEGLDAARGQRPDLILCDIQLPGIDGYEVARRIKASSALRDIPLVAVTAFAMVGDRDKILAAEFDGYLPKPIAPETFVQEVESFLKPELRSRSRLHAAIITDHQSQPPDPNGPTVLVVDDDQMNLELSTTLLGHSGYRVITAKGAREAMQRARDVNPDLILSDVCMAEGSGYDFIRTVKADAQLSSIPFIFITSTMTNDTARAAGLALGARAFLFRPIDPHVLLKEIEACLRRQQDD
jgi:two-component system cell cycle response regulator